MVSCFLSVLSRAVAVPWGRKATEHFHCQLVSKSPSAEQLCPLLCLQVREEASGCRSQSRGFPGGNEASQGSRICLQCGRPRFHSWAGKMPWRRERQPPLVFWPGEFRGPYSPWGCKESDRTQQLSLLLNWMGVFMMVTTMWEQVENIIQTKNTGNTEKIIRNEGLPGRRQGTKSRGAQRGVTLERRMC